MIVTDAPVYMNRVSNCRHFIVGTQTFLCDFNFHDGYLYAGNVLTNLLHLCGDCFLYRYRDGHFSEAVAALEVEFRVPLKFVVFQEDAGTDAVDGVHV